VRGGRLASGAAPPPVGTLRHVSISGVQADGAGPTGCAIAGIPGHQIEDVTLENIRLSFAGGGTGSEAAREVPEKTDAYPEFSMFGRLPGYGFYCRHVKGLRLRDVETACASPEGRPALVCDDIETAELAGCAFDSAAPAEAAVRLADARDVFAHGCRATRPIGAWMQVKGARSRGIRLAANDLARAARAVDAAAGVPGDAVVVDGRA